MVNVCCNAESFNLIANLETNPLIQIATFPTDVNAPTKIIYKRQKHVTFVPESDDEEEEETYEEDEHIFDVEKNEAKNPKQIVIYKPTVRK